MARLEEEPYLFWLKVKFWTLHVKPCGHDKDYRFCLMTSKVRCWWWEEEPYWFLFAGSKANVKFGNLPVKPFGHDPIYFRSWCEMLWSTLAPCDGMPHFVFSLMFFDDFLHLQQYQKHWIPMKFSHILENFNYVALNMFMYVRFSARA